ncbi:unnamed protein product [Prunus armeniaca]
MNSEHEIGLADTYTSRHLDEAPMESHETAQTSGGCPMKLEAMLTEDDFPHMQNHRTYVGPKFVSAGSTTTKVELQHFFTINSEPPLSHPSEAVPEDPIPQANMVDPHATLVDQATVINNVYELTSTIPLNGETKLEPILLLTLEALIRPLASGIGHDVVLMFCTMLKQAKGAYEKHNNVRTSEFWAGYRQQNLAAVHQDIAVSTIAHGRAGTCSVQRRFTSSDHNGCRQDVGWMWQLADRRVVMECCKLKIQDVADSWSKCRRLHECGCMFQGVIEIFRSKNQLRDQMGCKVAARVG